MVLKNKKTDTTADTNGSVVKKKGKESMGSVLEESVVENLKEDEQFEQYEEYMTRILQEINFTLDLSSSYCEICKTTRETYSSYIGNNMNITMKVLAAATILITVPNMIFGFYGSMKDKVL